MKKRTRPDIIIKANGCVYIAEVVDDLRYRGYDVTAQQLRKYENFGLFKPEKTEGNFRIYNKDVINIIATVYEIKLTGFSLKRIKEFLDLEKEIKEYPQLRVRYIWDEKAGEQVAVKEIKVHPAEKNDKYYQFLILIKNYNLMCSEIEEKLEKTRDIVSSGIRKMDLRKIKVDEEGLVKK